MLDQLPPELVIHVYERLTMEEMGKLSICCKRLHDIVQTDLLYQKYVEYYYNNKNNCARGTKTDIFHLWLIDNPKYFKRFYGLYPNDLNAKPIFNDILRHVCVKENLDLISWLGKNVSSEIIKKNTFGAILVCYPVNIVEVFVKSFPLAKEREGIYYDLILCTTDERLSVLKTIKETNPWINIAQIKEDMISYAQRDGQTKVIEWLENLV